MDRIDLRPAGPADRDAWGALRAACLAMHDAASARDPRDVSGPIARTRDAAVGLVHRLHHTHSWRSEDAVSLRDLSEARGRDIARQAIHPDADARGAPRVQRRTQARAATAPAPSDRIGRDARLARDARPL